MRLVVHAKSLLGVVLLFGVALLVGLDHNDDGILARSGPSSPDSGRTGGGSGIPGSRCKRVRLRRKTPVHEVFRESLGDHSRSRAWKRLRLGISLVGEDDDAGRRHLHDHLDFGCPVHDRTGIG